MTELDLKERMERDLEHIVAPTDLLERARRGGARRARRRLACLTATATAVVAVAGAITIPALHRHTTDTPTAGMAALTPTSTPMRALTSPQSRAQSGDPFAALLRGKTRGDLANDSVFLGQALATWKDLTDRTHLTTGDDPYPGTPKVYWAGNTPAGKAALVVQPTTMFEPGTDAKSHPVGGTFIGESDSGRLEIHGGIWPGLPGIYWAILAKGSTSVLIVLTAGTSSGQWSMNGEAIPLQPFKDGISITELPSHTQPLDVDFQLLRTR